MYDYSYGSGRQQRGIRPYEGNFMQALVVGTGIFIIVLLIFYGFSRLPGEPAAGTRFVTDEWPAVFAQQQDVLDGFCEVEVDDATGLTTVVDGSCEDAQSVSPDQRDSFDTTPIDTAIDSILEEELLQAGQ